MDSIQEILMIITGAFSNKNLYYAQYNSNTREIEIKSQFNDETYMFITCIFTNVYDTDYSLQFYDKDFNLLRRLYFDFNGRTFSNIS